MTPKPLHVVGIGELLWDDFPSGRKIGGAPANFAYHCQALGAEAHVVSAVGDDAPGAALLAGLRHRHLDTAHIHIDPIHPTGRVSVSLDTEGVASYTIHEKVAWDAIPLTSALLDLAARTDAVCFGTLAQRSGASRRTIDTFLSATRPDCLRVFDINLRQSYFNAELIEAGLQRATILKLNEEELGTLIRLLGLEKDPLAAIDTLRQRFDLELIALTRGPQGCLLRSDGQTVEAAGSPVPTLRDTVGAGDCFTATLTLGLLRGQLLKEVAAEANRRAAFVCAQTGAMPDMSSLTPETSFAS
ncbi:MAG: carbohydrate kinase [Bacteroidetes bacterium]|nr:carbohydrate kinase [Bacteroidota bacterium]MDA0874517.1 carbohydrate kinase [Bacteroidota bacterium]